MTKHALRASGTAAGIHTPGLDPQERPLAAGLRPGEDGWGEGEPARFVDSDGEQALALERGAYERFYAGLRDAAPMPVDPRDSVGALRVIEAARASAAAGAVIDTPDTNGLTSSEGVSARTRGRA